MEIIKKSIRMNKLKVCTDFQMTLDDDFNFKGFFTCDRLGECLGRLTNEDRCYISGAMDFMVQTANSAIDGLYVGKLADEGYNEYKDQLPQESPLKTNEDRRNAICGRVNTTFGDSLLSIFEKNPPSKKQLCEMILKNNGEIVCL